MLARALAMTLSRIEAGWTSRQLDYVLAVYTSPEQPKDKLAASLGVSRNTVFKTLRSAHHREYRALLDALRTAIR